MDHVYLILLRVLHIAFGAFWTGAAIYVAAFVGPAVNKLGPDGSKFMRQIVQTNRLPLVLMVVPLVTVVTGLLMIWKVSAGFDEEWTASTHGKVLMTGALMAFIAFFYGLFVNRPTADKISRLGQEVAKSGGPPSTAQAAELGRLSLKLGFGAKVMAWFVAFAIIAMSMSHYL